MECCIPRFVHRQIGCTNRARAPRESTPGCYNLTRLLWRTYQHQGNIPIKLCMRRGSHLQAHGGWRLRISSWMLSLARRPQVALGHFEPAEGRLEKTVGILALPGEICRPKVPCARLAASATPIGCATSSASFSNHWRLVVTFRVHVSVASVIFPASAPGFSASHAARKPASFHSSLLRVC